MYNRYIPQTDGSYRRNAMPESRPSPPRQTSPPQQSAPHSVPPRTPAPPEPISGFLRQLIPKEFDTGDLIIVLLLLLIAGDNQERRSNALLTLALYFIL